jgi:hypothetical protein
MTIEDRLRQALADSAGAAPSSPDRWDEIERRAALARSSQAHRRARWRAGGLSVFAVAAAVTALVALPALRRESTNRVGTAPGGTPITTAGSPSSLPGTSRPQATTPTTSGRSQKFSYQPLYPFTSLQDVRVWQAANRSGGHQPWHLDPGQTALSFTGFLGYSDINTVISSRVDASGAHVSVGFSNPNGQPGIAAVVHLIRFGTGADAPWEVVGTDDTPDFSLTAPRYGAIVTSPVTVGGQISGVDESIKIQVFQQSSQAPLGQSCCLAAGGTASPWSTTEAFHGATNPVLIIAASTGGHLAAVERFTVTGVRTSAAPPTPGL